MLHTRESQNFTGATPSAQSYPSNGRASAVVRDATVGDGLILNRTSGGQIVLHDVTADTPRELGTFDDVVDAWKAVDKVDAVELETAGAIDALA